MNTETSPKTLLPNGYEYLGLEILDNNHTYVVPGLDPSRVYVASEIRDAFTQRDELLAALKNSLAVLMETHKQARGMWNELLAAGFADKDLKMPNHDANLAAIERARAAVARCRCL